MVGTSVPCLTGSSLLHHTSCRAYCDQASVSPLASTICALMESERASTEHAPAAPSVNSAAELELQTNQGQSSQLGSCTVAPTTPTATVITSPPPLRRRSRSPRLIHSDDPTSTSAGSAGADPTQDFLLEIPVPPDSDKTFTIHLQLKIVQERCTEVTATSSV